MKVAIVHDWLVTYAGAERVLEQLLLLYPEADLYSLIDFVPENERAFLQGRRPHTSFLQRVPGARRKYRNYLALMPMAIEQFDLSAYDLVISSSYAVAKGVLTGPEQLHVCFCHSPLRYAWDLQHQYLRETNLQSGLRSAFARYLLHRVRLWDLRTANGVDRFIAISAFIARRIWKVYRRESVVIYPPVDVETFTPGGEKADYYVTASRLVPYKRIDLIVDAFAQMPDRRLVVIGDGPDAAKLRGRLTPNIQFLGYQPLPALREHLRQARAFIFAAEEDFGIAPLEAQACGTPVVAFGRGGARESVRGLDQAEPTGVFLLEPTVAAPRAAVDRFEHAASQLTPEACRANAVRFEAPRFRRQFRNYVESQWQEFRSED
jgi:glycosyltransferase involved in cell wall biosynthesis